ncbi:MAG: hypothetical protein WEB00_05635 [Dehalococcoidia bacterium]
MQDGRRQFRIAVLAFALYLGTLAGGTLLLAQTLGAVGGGQGFSVPRYEVDHLLGHGLYQLRVAFGLENRSDGEERELILEFLALTAEARDLAEADATDPRIDAVLARRDQIENDVEAVLAGYVADAIRSAGLTTELPLFSSAEPVWPPVALEFERPPRILAVSPRDRIELVSSDLLDPDLESAEAIEIEQRSEDDGFSALVEDIGGLGSYPSNVRPGLYYERLLTLIAHEWMHHYLSFYPLGLTYFDNAESRILNETVATLVGNELGDEAVRLHPIEGAPAPPAPTTTIDFRGTMRSLRLEVDDLLAQGDIAQAEARMEEVRQQLADEDIFIRRINQAYFAFHGSYGDAPQSSSPIGPLINELREASASLARFVVLVREITTERELARAADAVQPD